ncbi:MAG: hypothetical protein ACLUOF_02380 [Ruminococcus sp.]
MQQLKNRLAFLRLLLVLLFCTAAVYLAWLVQKPELIQTAARQGTYTCTAGLPGDDLRPERRAAGEYQNRLHRSRQPYACGSRGTAVPRHRHRSVL